MKFSRNWLHEWVDPGLDDEALAAQLTAAGLEVDTVEPVAAGPLDKVLVAEVRAVEPHPDAERLRLCAVDAGEAGAFSVVCGAPNVHAGMRAPLALVGASLPGGVKIRKSEIRGQASEGMLCSARELGLGDDADGIIALDADAPVGVALSAHLGLDDVSIDVDLTPNRGDCLSIAGLAREVAVLNRREVGGAPPIDPVAAVIEDTFPVVLEAPADCPRYAGRVIRDIDPSARTPMWMQERLRRCGLRGISPVVDVTNYVMIEQGQPMHAFDLDKLDTGIRVRRARDGERLELLDDSEVVIDSEVLVIADESASVAMGGIMGGMASAVTDATRNIFLEAAYFMPRLIGVESRRHAMHTDSSHRFERGVPTDGQARAIERATALLLDIVGGRPGPTVDVIASESMPPPTVVALRAARIERVLGVPVPPETVVDVLQRLGMRVEPTADGWEVGVPPFRSDITIETDLIEEVARIWGYDAVPEHAPEDSLSMTGQPEAHVGLARLRSLLIERGYQEAITYSFVSPRMQAMVDAEVDVIELANPISADMSVMRSSIWPGLLQAALYNANRQQARVRLFESGLTFERRDGAVRQEGALAGVAMGPVVPEQWGAERRDADFFDLKSDVEALLALAAPAGAFTFERAAHPALHPGQTARVQRDGVSVGILGVLHPRIASDLKFAAPVLLFELEMAALEAGHLPRFEALSKFPAVRRDLSVVVNVDISAAAVRKCVGQAGVDVLKNLELFDVYRGEGIDSGKKSLALGLLFQSGSRTLEDLEIDEHVREILGCLEQDLGAELRG